jgi:hypothetical protein
VTGEGRELKDLDQKALDLLQFVEDSVNEAIEDVSSRPALLMEATCALRVLKATLRRNEPDSQRLSMLRLTEALDCDFAVLAENNADPVPKLREALKGVLSARMMFDREQCET